MHALCCTLPFVKPLAGILQPEKVLFFLFSFFFLSGHQNVLELLTSVFINFLLRFLSPFEQSSVVWCVSLFCQQLQNPARFFSVQYTNKGCQMVCSQTKNTNLGKFLEVLRCQMYVYFVAIWPILWPSGIFYWVLVYFKLIWYIYPVLASCR
jgi:hypothetical protein